MLKVCIFGLHSKRTWERWVSWSMVFRKDVRQKEVTKATCIGWDRSTLEQLRFAFYRTRRQENKKERNIRSSVARDLSDHSMSGVECKQCIQYCRLWYSIYKMFFLLVKGALIVRPPLTDCLVCVAESFFQRPMALVTVISGFVCFPPPLRPKLSPLTLSIARHQDIARTFKCKWRGVSSYFIPPKPLCPRSAWYDRKRTLGVLLHSCLFAARKENLW